MEELDWVRRLNYHGSMASGAKNIVPIDHYELIDLAITGTGLSDFGDDLWQRQYQVYIERLNHINKVHLLGRIRIKTLLLNGLMNRLLIIEKIKRAPEIKNEPIKKPIFITGLPRTGTTILFSLLSLDPTLRSPKGYEVASPAENAARSRKEKINSEQRAQCLFDFEMDIHRGVKSMHNHRQDYSVECQNIMLNTLTMFHREIIADHTSQISYENSLSQYIWHKKVLQILQHKASQKKWLLKCPSHINSLDKLFSVYPDAQILHIHRDPVLAIPSCAKLLKFLTESYCIKNEFQKTFEDFVSYLEISLRKTIKYKQLLELKGVTIHDIQLSDLETRPIDTIRDIYTKLGMTFTEDMKIEIISHLKNNQREKHERYSKYPSVVTHPTFKLRNQFKFYTDYYHIPTK